MGYAVEVGTKLNLISASMLAEVVPARKGSLGGIPLFWLSSRSLEAENKLFFFLVNAFVQAESLNILKVGESLQRKGGCLPNMKRGVPHYS